MALWLLAGKELLEKKGEAPVAFWREKAIAQTAWIACTWSCRSRGSLTAEWIGRLMRPMFLAAVCPFICNGSDLLVVARLTGLFARCSLLMGHFEFLSFCPLSPQPAPPPHTHHFYFCMQASCKSKIPVDYENRLSLSLHGIHFPTKIQLKVLYHGTTHRDFAKQSDKWNLSTISYRWEYQHIIQYERHLPLALNNIHPPPPEALLL